MSIIKGEGHFILDSKTRIISGSGTENETNYLAAILKNAFWKAPVINTVGKKGILLKINSEIIEITGNEGYVFTASTKNICIEAATTAGIFYGIQTLRQLLPPDFEYVSDKKKSATGNTSCFKWFRYC